MQVIVSPISLHLLDQVSFVELFLHGHNDISFEVIIQVLGVLVELHDLIICLLHHSADNVVYLLSNHFKVDLCRLK